MQACKSLPSGLIRGFRITLAFILSQADNARNFKHKIFISRYCKCAMPYTLSVLRKMLKHVFNSEIKFWLVSDNLCGIQYLRHPVSYAAVI